MRLVVFGLMLPLSTQFSEFEKFNPTEGLKVRLLEICQ